MKKPVLLLVDDDASVLSALEAELAPEVRDIMSVEAFADPRLVIEALPRWTAEGRPIAVAIVDQKMPGMSGVELLKALSPPPPDAGEPPPFHPGRHTRRLMLTGYADLDSAIASLNEGGVDRYLEKPWDGSQLRAETRAAIHRWLEASPHGVHYVLRQTENAEEVRDLFRLRYAIYAESSLQVFGQRADDAQMEADAHDALSRLFGLMQCGSGPPTMVGALRVVGQTVSPQIAWIGEVTESHPLLRAALAAPPRTRLPLLEYLPERAAVSALVEALLARGEGVSEPSRLVLRQAYRARAIGARTPLARHLIESAVAFFFFFRIPHAILTCAKDHRAFYRPFGFRQTEGTTLQVYKNLGIEFGCLHGTMDTVPEPARTRCESLAARIRRTGGACSCESLPDCLGGPYETGDFSGADVFCPLLACERERPA